MKRDEYIQQVVDMMIGIKEPTREVIDWLNEQDERNNLSLWERASIAFAESFDGESISTSYQLYRNVMEIFSSLHDAKIGSRDKELRNEIDSELALMLDWLDAFDEIDDYSGEFTSEAMLAELS